MVPAKRWPRRTSCSQSATLQPLRVLHSPQVGTELIRALRDERPISGRHMLLECVRSEEGHDEAPTGQQLRDGLVSGVVARIDGPGWTPAPPVDELRLEVTSFVVAITRRQAQGPSVLMDVTQYCRCGSRCNGNSCRGSGGYPGAGHHTHRPSTAHLSTATGERRSTSSRRSPSSSK